MVYINPEKTVFSEKTEPKTREWDLNMRRYYADYQELINQNQYRLQKGLKGIALLGSWNFPYRYQHRYLLVELYSKKQLLGEISSDEIDRYSKIHSGIRGDLRHTFNGSSLRNMWPGIAFAIGANVYGVMGNVNYYSRIAMTIVPLLLNFAINRMRVQPYFNTIQFLDWCVQDRTAQSRAEIDSYGLREYMQKNKEHFSQLQDANGVVDIHSAFEELQRLT